MHMTQVWFRPHVNKAIIFVSRMFVLALKSPIGGVVKWL